MRPGAASPPLPARVGARIYASIPPGLLVQMLHGPAFLGGARAADDMAVAIEAEAVRVIRANLRFGPLRAEIEEMALDLVRVAIYDVGSPHHWPLVKDFEACVARRTEAARKAVSRRAARFETSAFESSRAGEPVDLREAVRMDLLRRCSRRFAAIEGKRDRELALLLLRDLSQVQVAALAGCPRSEVGALLATLR